MSSPFELDVAVKVEDEKNVIEFFKSNKRNYKLLFTYLEGLGKKIPDIEDEDLRGRIEKLCETFPEEAKRLYQWILALGDVSINYLKDSAEDDPELSKNVAELKPKGKVIVEFLIRGFQDKLRDAFMYGKLESFERETGKIIQTNIENWLDREFKYDDKLKDKIQRMLDEKYTKLQRRFIVQGLKREENGTVQISFLHEVGDKWVRQLPDRLGGSHWDRPAKRDVILIDPQNRKIVTTYKRSRTFIDDVVNSVARSDVQIDLKDETYNFEIPDKAIEVPNVDEITVRGIKELLGKKVLCAIEYRDLNAEGSPSRVIIEGDDVEQFLAHLSKSGIEFDDWVDENKVTKTYRLSDGRKFKISRNKLSPTSRKFSEQEKMILKSLFSAG